MDNLINDAVGQRIKEVAALLLWKNGAIQVSANDPFKLVSGNYSPIYINCRLVISDPIFMRLFTTFSRIIIASGQASPEVIAGGETAGIPFASYLASDLSLPMVYVRKQSKDHGIRSLVEGKLSPNARVLLVEDLITDAGSKVGFINALRSATGIVEHVLVLFDRQQGGRQALQEMGIELYSITDLTTALSVAYESKFITNEDLSVVDEYSQSPLEWHAKRDLVFMASNSE